MSIILSSMHHKNALLKVVVKISLMGFFFCLHFRGSHM